MLIEENTKKKICLTSRVTFNSFSGRGVRVSFSSICHQCLYLKNILNFPRRKIRVEVTFMQIYKYLLKEDKYDLLLPLFSFVYSV